MLSVALRPTSTSDARAATQSWSRTRWFVILTALTLATFVTHGYHPLAEDGGLYVAGVEFGLDRSLFPHSTPFVAEHLRFSLFAPLLSALIRLTHLSLGAVLLLADLGAIALTLAAARALLRRTVVTERAQLAGVAMLAAMWTLPVAATSLLLMDPYVTARSLSTPLSLFAVAFALDPWLIEDSKHPRSARSLVGCVVCLLLAALVHPLMAGYAVGLVIALRLLRSRQRLLLLSCFAFAVLAFSTALQATAPAETPPVAAASLTRYYWFLSEWRWYELLGLAGPLLVFAATLRAPGLLSRSGATLCRAALFLAPLAVLVALLFAHESYSAHLVARLQPLRCFLPLYAVMVLLLGASLEELTRRTARRINSLPMRLVIASLPALIIVVTAAIMYAVQRAEFPASAHLELPWRAQSNPNPWVQAFEWSRANTPRNALFALDAHYITIPGEDAQSFRAISERSSLPDFSKDGGEAAITPRLAQQWARGVEGQLNLIGEDDATRRAQLQPFGVNWLVLLRSAKTSLPCPYENGAVKVCRLSR
jgi:hypothetical protein